MKKIQIKKFMKVVVGTTDLCNDLQIECHVFLVQEEIEFLNLFKNGVLNDIIDQRMGETCCDPTHGMCWFHTIKPKLVELTPFMGTGVEINRGVVTSLIHELEEKSQI